MNKSESIKNLAMALKKAQAQMGEVKFDAVNPFFKSKYASLGAVIEASKSALVENGLSVSQPATVNEFGVGITTILMHESGEFIEDTVTLPVTSGSNLAQEAGKTITYLRRYSLASLLNLYSDEDTDGNEPKKAQSKPVEKPENGKVWKPEIVDAVVKEYKLNHPNHAVSTLNLSAKLTPDSDVKTVLAWVKCYKEARDGMDLERPEAAKVADKEVLA